MSWALQEYKVQVKPTPSLFSIYMGKPVVQFTVWVNGKQNSEKVNFLRNSVYHLHKPVPFKAKQLRKPETGMVSNTTFSIEHEFPSGKTALPFQIFPYSWKFSTGMTLKNVFNLLSDRIFRKHFVNGKQPYILLMWSLCGGISRCQYQIHVIILASLMSS